MGKDPTGFPAGSIKKELPMGYVSRYELEARLIPSADTPTSAIAALVATDEEAADCLESDGSTRNRGKWYDHEKTLRAHSRLYPHLVFVLRGEGEESGDIWVKYFQNGKMQVERAELKLGEFDPTKLK